jgi:hypothetical protein
MNRPSNSYIFSPSDRLVSRGIALLTAAADGGGGAGGNGGKGASDGGKGKEEKPDIGKIVAEEIGKITPTLTTLIEQTIDKKIAGLKPVADPGNKNGEGKEGEKKKDEEESAKDAVQRLEGEIKKRDQQLESKDAENAARTALASVQWFDLEDAARELLPTVKKNDKGAFVVPTEVVVAGVKITKELTLAEAVQGLAKRKAHWVKTEVQDGTGASGSSGSGGAGTQGLSAMSYAQIMRHPDRAAVSKFMKDHPAEYQTKKDAHYANPPTVKKAS